MDNPKNYSFLQNQALQLLGSGEQSLSKVMHFKSLISQMLLLSLTLDMKSIYARFYQAKDI